MNSLPQNSMEQQLKVKINELKRELSIKEDELTSLCSSKKDSNKNGDFNTNRNDPIKYADRYKIVSDLTSDFAYAFSVNEKKDLKYEWGFGALLEITGYTREELTSKGGWKTLIYNEDISRAFKQFELLINGKANTQEYRIRNREGDIKWVRDYAKPIIDEESGRVVLIYGAIQDITEMKKADESLFLSNLVLVNSPAVLFRWKASSDWPVSYVSQNISQYGYTQDDFLSGNVKYSSIIHPDDLEQVIQEVLKYTNSDSNNFRQQYRIFTKDKKVCWIDDRSNIERDSHGNPTYYQGVILDITENKLAEESLKESEERLRLALNSANQGLYDLNIISGEAIVSPEYAAMLGYDHKSFKETNKKWQERLHPDDREKTANNFNDYINNKIPHYRIDFRQKTASNNWIWIQSSGKIVEWDSDGNPKRMLGTHTDITSKKTIEFALRESEQQYKLLFSNNPNPMLIFDQETLFILDANEAAIMHYGYSRDEFKEMTIKEIRPKEDIEAMLKVINNLGEEISSAKGYRHKKKNGEIINVDTTASSIVFNGRNARLVVIHDITEKYLAEQALKESEKEYKNIFIDSHDCIFVASTDGSILNINNAGNELLGLVNEENTKINFLEFFVSLQEREKFENNILESGFVKNYFIKLRNKKNKILDCLLTASVKTDNSGIVKSYQGIIRDITDERKAQNEILKAKEKAEKADRLKTEFLAQMSHEIRTPINSIMSYAELLKSETIDLIPEDLKFSFDMINNGGRRLIRTVDLILNMSEIQTGTYELIVEKCNIVETIEKLVYEFKTGATSKNLNLSLVNKLDKENFIVKLDIYTITQIFANLIDNAIKYTVEGEIEVNIYKNETSRLCIAVADTGIGISKDFQKELFEAFTQEEQGYTRKFEGNGLGMALVKEYCKMNNAKIFVESEKGKGTTFMVEFPVLLN